MTGPVVTWLTHFSFLWFIQLYRVYILSLLLKSSHMKCLLPKASQIMQYGNTYIAIHSNTNTQYSIEPHFFIPTPHRSLHISTTTAGKLLKV